MSFVLILLGFGTYGYTSTVHSVPFETAKLCMEAGQAVQEVSKASNRQTAFICAKTKDN